jgi:hypothetical protein
MGVPGFLSVIGDLAQAEGGMEERVAQLFGKGGRGESTVVGRANHS